MVYSVQCFRVSGTSDSRSCIAFPWRNTRLHRQWHLVGRDRHRADHRHRHFLARPHFAGKDRREEKASSDQSDPVPLSTLALLWRIALAPRVALGLLEAGLA